MVRASHAGCMAKHLERIEQHKPPIWRTKVALSAVLMLIVVVLTVYGFRWLVTDRPDVPEPTVAVNRGESESVDPSDEPALVVETPASETTIVHVAGEVKRPGIVELGPDSRVVDAIESAGGPTDAAQLDALNLAAAVNDGDYILVPNQETAADANAQGPPTHSGAPGGTDAAPKVNVNTADSAELETLPGIGPATAADIIAHREQHGPFTQLADLEAVSGIGPATRERLDGLVTW